MWYSARCWKVLWWWWLMDLTCVCTGEFAEEFEVETIVGKFLCQKQGGVAGEVDDMWIAWSHVGATQRHPLPKCGACVWSTMASWTTSTTAKAPKQNDGHTGWCKSRTHTQRVDDWCKQVMHSITTTQSLNGQKDDDDEEDIEKNEG